MELSLFKQLCIIICSPWVGAAGRAGGKFKGYIAPFCEIEELKKAIRYPEELRSTNIEGNVYLKVLFNKTVLKTELLDDLDGLYFFDKIDMRSNSTSHKKIPKLDLKVPEPKIAKKIVPVYFIKFRLLR